MKNQPQTETTAKTKDHHDLAMILPPAFLSETTTHDINAEIDRQLARFIERTTKPVVIHLPDNKRKASDYLHNAVKKYTRITAKTYHPRYKNNDKKHNANAKRRALGNLITNSDYLMVLEGSTRALSIGDNDLLNMARAHDVKIINRKIKITPDTPREPTPLKDQPKKSQPIKPAAAYRVNLNQYTNGKRRWNTLQDCIDDPHVSRPTAAIYCGRTHKARKAKASPLANYNTKGTTAENIAAYRIDLDRKIKANDPEIMAELRKIEPTTPLICYCDNRKNCHTDVIRTAAAYIHKQDAKNQAYFNKAVKKYTADIDTNNDKITLSAMLRQRETLRQQLSQLDTRISKAQNVTREITYMISGHLDLTENEFQLHYMRRIMDAAKNPQALFVLGDAKGCDQKAGSLLQMLKAGDRSTKYHAGELSRNYHSTIKEVGGFAHYTARDAAMTAASNTDIAWVREGKERSGTAKNIARRASK